MAEREPLPRMTRICYPGVCFDENGEVILVGPHSLAPSQPEVKKPSLMHMPFSFAEGMVQTEFRLAAPPASPAPVKDSNYTGGVCTLLSGLLRRWDEVQRTARSGRLTNEDLEEQRMALLQETAGTIAALDS